MIKYIKRTDIDVEKYDTCIGNSMNSRIYAYSWYLDIVSDNWDALVLNDYETVMPLPWRSKYFIKYIYPPCWVQQLGVFSSEKVENELIKEFIEAIPRKFKKITIHFNAENNFFVEGKKVKVNYILPLNKPYAEMVKGYKNLRRRKLKKVAFDKITIEKSNSISELIELFKKEKEGGLFIKQSDYNKLERLIKYLVKTKRANISYVRNEDDELIGGMVVLNDQKRITYLFSSMSRQGKEYNVITGLIDFLIKKYANTKYTLDFEGSMIPGIAFFFESYGAKVENYYLFKKEFRLF